MRFLEHINDLVEADFHNPELYFEISEIPTNMAQSIAIQQLAEKAKSLHIKHVFENNIRALKRDLKNQHSVSNVQSDSNKTSFSMLDNTTELPERIAEEMSHIPGQLNCGPWVCDDQGVRVKTDKSMMVACPHPIVPVKILRNIETGRYKAELVFQLRGQTQNIYVRREILASPSKILELAAYAVIIKARTAPLLCEYFADMETYNPSILKEFASTGKLGWVTSEGKDYFIPYDKEIMFDSESEFRQLYSSIKAKGSRTKWYSCILDIREKRQPAFLLNLAACFASVLCSPCKTLSFIVSLWGRTGIGKSVILKICASVWADPDEGKYISDPKATPSAMELRLNALNSMPMLIDDLAQIATRDKDCSKLIYEWCSRSGKPRATKEMTMRETGTWCNCTLTNSERPIVDELTQGGAVNRVIDIECDEILFTGSEGNKIVKTISNNYGYAGEEFVDVIKSIGFDEVNRMYGQYYDEIREAAKELGIEKEDKQAMAMSLVLVADELIEKHLFKDGIRVDINTAIGYLKNKGEISETETTYKKIMDMVVMHSNNFLDSLNSDISTLSGHELWGVKIDKNHIGIIPEAFKIIIGDNSLEKPFLSWAKVNKLLETDKGKNQKSVWFCGRSQKMYVIDTTWGEDPIDDSLLPEVPFK